MNLPPPERPQENDDGLIPLINIVFLLLIFFMVAGALSAQHVLQVEAPESELAGLVEPPDALILLDAQGRLAVEDVPVDADGLREHLRGLLLDAESGPEEFMVHIKADQAASAEALLDVMDLLRDLGLAKVTLLTVLGTSS